MNHDTNGTLTFTLMGIDFSGDIILFYVILIVNINRLLKKLPPGTSNLNYYSFGTYPMLPYSWLNLDIPMLVFR